MTGALALYGRESRAYKSFKVHDVAWPPRFCKLELVFSNGERLAYCDPRRIGRVRVRGKDAAAEPPISQLAPDALDSLDLEAFSRALRDMSVEIKVALLNQEKLVSGIGNWLADEILYQCRMHPQVKCCDLRDDQAQEIGRKINEVCSIASECTKAGKEFPAHWLFHFRWTKANSTKPHDALGNAIMFETVGGRTSAIVLAMQPRPSNSNSKQAPAKKKKAAGEGASKKSVKSVKSAKSVKLKTEKEPAADKPTTSKYFPTGTLEMEEEANLREGEAPAVIKKEKRPAPKQQKAEAAGAKRTKR